MQQCNSATVQQCNSATNTGNKLNALLAALALVAAALATPSAFAYGAVYWLSSNSGIISSNRTAINADTRTDAIDAAENACNELRNGLANPDIFTECELGITFNSDIPEERCVAAASFNSGGFRDSLVYATGTSTVTARQNAIDLCLKQDGITTCENVNIEDLEDTNFNALCDETGLDCAENLFANQELGECETCPTGTHGIFNGICEEIAECDADSEIRNENNRCETCDFDKSPQNNECVCTDENTLDVEGTCTRILECIGNQIRDPEMPTECMNCGDKTANEERNLCEAACTGDNEIKDGEGDCRTCESDSIPNEENTECLPNCSNHDEYKDTDGYCVQCNTGLVASDNNDSCVAVPAVKTPSSKTGVVLGLVVLGVYAANVFAAPAAAEVAAINWTPSYAFRNNNGNISYSVGSRWTARTDNWRYYWQTTQSGGKFSYGSGMNYKTGIFAATMDSESDSDITDLDISLSATKAAGLWHFNGGYNLDARLSATERTEMQNRLNIAARYSLDKWILSATANTDGDRAAARINYSYRF